jgi:hypothetical protein
MLEADDAHATAMFLHHLATVAMPPEEDHTTRTIETVYGRCGIALTILEILTFC